MTWTFESLGEPRHDHGENVLPGVNNADHDAGLENLARYLGRTR